MVDGEVRFHTGIALAPEYPERGLGGAEGDDHDEIEARRCKMEGEETQGHGACRGDDHGGRKDGGIVA